jgi:sugar phosphate isomerase/epimerase
MSNLLVGAQLYSVRDRTQDAESMLKTLKEIKAIGYNTCQLSGHGKAISNDEVCGMLKESGLTCVSTHISFDEIQEDLGKVIAEHKALGCAYPGIGGLPARYRKGAEGYLAFAKEASVIAQRLSDAGLTFVYHNHNFEFERLENGKTGLQILLENSCDALQFELDVFWVQAAGASPLDSIEAVRGRMDVVHFKEMGYGEGLTVRMMPVGEGNMNWPKIIAACDAIGVKYALVEQDNAIDTDSIACMRTSFENLKRMGARF